MAIATELYRPLSAGSARFDAVTSFTFLALSLLVMNHFVTSLRQTSLFHRLQDQLYSNVLEMDQKRLLPACLFTTVLSTVNSPKVASRISSLVTGVVGGVLTLMLYLIYV